MSYLVRSTINPPWYNKSLVYLMWTSHQAIIKQSSFSSLNLFICLSWKKCCRIYLSHVTQAVGLWNRLNFRSHHSVFIIYLWQGEVIWLGHCIMNIFDNIWKSQTMKLWARARKPTIFNGETYCVFLQLTSTAISPTNYVIQYFIITYCVGKCKAIQLMYLFLQFFMILKYLNIGAQVCCFFLLWT